jgi:UDP-GlcNAc:undecaprenyl-phosphate GlcNAc-1-phosphate transferase
MNILSLIIVILFNIIFYINLKKISKIIGIYDYPDNLRKQHGQIVPPIGGVAIIFSLIIFCLVNLLISNKEIYEEFFYESDKIDLKSTFCFYFCTISLFLLGLKDDKDGLSANLRLFFFGLIFYFAILLDNQLVIKSIDIETLKISIELESLKIFVTVFCFLVLVNSLNMYDGINLQSGSYLFFIFLFFTLKNIFSIFSILIMISLLFFLFFNYKNKIFLGNQGVYSISFIIAFFIIKNYNTKDSISVEEVYLLLFLPMLDLLRLLIARVYKNQNPFKADRNHIHHYVNNRLGNVLKTCVLNNLIAFTPLIIFTIYKSFYILVVTTILYFFLIFFIKK